jgi:hypothetical protein
MLPLIMRVRARRTSSVCIRLRARNETTSAGDRLHHACAEAFPKTWDRPAGSGVLPPDLERAAPDRGGPDRAAPAEERR